MFALCNVYNKQQSVIVKSCAKINDYIQIIVFEYSWISLKQRQCVDIVIQDTQYKL